MNEKINLINQLEKIADDYKKIQTERKELLGYGRTDKRNVVQKSKMLDERLKKLKINWHKTITEIDPLYGELLKRTSPSQNTVNKIKQMIDEQ